MKTKILKYIECAYWTCKYKSIDFTIKHGQGKHTCTKLNKNMDHWVFINAPKWCPKRKKNGGHE